MGKKDILMLVVSRDQDSKVPCVVDVVKVPAWYKLLRKLKLRNKQRARSLIPSDVDEVNRLYSLDMSEDVLRELVDLPRLARKSSSVVRAVLTPSLCAVVEAFKNEEMEGWEGV
jgi:hypothetical protein